MKEYKRIAVLGATGSIGRQTLDIISEHPERYRATVLTAGSRVEDLITAAKKFRPLLVIIGKEELLGRLKEELDPLGIECAAGSKALEECVDHPEIDMVLTATVGYSGLAPTVRAIKNGKDIALANKETLVVAGNYINSLLSESKSRLYPVDSEHSAIAQCLAGEDINSVSRLLITASGGPFRTWTAESMAVAEAKDALKHPKWNMGAKITIDSSTLLNKAFEIIEAHHLFGIKAEKIKAVVHPQSIVHSMVEFDDGAVKAQLGVPDMHLPIAYALGESSRLKGAERKLSLKDYSTLTFEEPDIQRFPCLGLAYRALHEGGTTACTINAANEVAVSAFLRGEIRFGRIYPLISETLERTSFISNPEYSDYVAINEEARKKAEEILRN